LNIIYVNTKMKIISHPISILNPYAKPFVRIPKLNLEDALKIQQEELNESEDEE
jgi:hypothetical protein